jgi:membrane associated rhomboid family serine protease
MDNESKPDHRLAAIMATDVVGYSKLMQSDEAAALGALAFVESFGILGGMQAGGVAYAAHIGGFIAGMVLIKIFAIGRSRKLT